MSTVAIVGAGTGLSSPVASGDHRSATDRRSFDEDLAHHGMFDGPR